tara:strand:+ start:6907 stop:7122 length:216 start_codon:yes stop_codon:yes gene_type:complete
MRLWKAFSVSMINLLQVLDNLTDGTNELSIMYREACIAARKEQEIEAKNDLNKLIGSSNLSEDEIAKLRAV